MASVHITWTPGSGNTGQDVQYKLSTSSTWILFQSVSSTTNSVVISGLLDSHIYNVRILNYCAGSGAASPGPTINVNTTPSSCNPPSGVSATLA